MPLVIAGGPSVTDYPKNELSALANAAYTIAVNATCFDWHCDLVCSIDPQFFHKFRSKLMGFKTPIIARKYPFNEQLRRELGIDIIEVPNEIIGRFPLSGMLAVKVGDRIANEADCRKNYVIGIDASVGHYKGHPQEDNTTVYLDEARPLAKYEDMGCTETINLSVNSKVSCWPKLSHLPKIYKVYSDATHKKMVTEWVREAAYKGELLG